MHKKAIKCVRRCVTLIEIMVVMFLIALITGVVAYNYRGTLEEGKAFKTQQGIERLDSILSLVLADNPSADMSGNNWQRHIESSPLVKNPDALIRDGWGEDFQVTVSEDNRIIINSNKYNNYRQRKK